MKRMSLSDIKTYVENNNEMNLTPDELAHVAMCMEHIQRW